MSEERIEDFVLAQSWMQDAKVEPLLQAFFDRLAPKISLGATTFGVIKAFSNIDERAVKVADVLRANPYYEYHFLEVVNSLSKREETPGTDTAVVLLGMQNSRDLIIAMQMMRTVFDSHPEWRPDGKLDLEPPEVLRFARKTEQIFEGDKEMANIAYAAGLIFDLLVLLAGRYSDDSKKVIAFIEHIYNHGLRSAHVGMAIADTIPDFPVKRLVFAASLVHDVGKAAMAILNLDYLQFNELSIKKELTRQVRLHAEGIRYGVHHAAIGGLICRYFESLYQVEKAVLFHHDPYLLARRNRSDHQLASLVCLASNVANHFKRPDRPDDPVLKSWKGRELDAFTVGKTDLIEAVTRVMRERS